MSDASKPHVASILIQIEVYENATGSLVDQHKLNEFGIKSKEKIEIKGFDQFELLKKLQSKLSGLKS
jgi:hypothetical protein